MAGDRNRYSMSLGCWHVGALNFLYFFNDKKQDVNFGGIRVLHKTFVDFILDSCYINLEH